MDDFYSIELTSQNENLSPSINIENIENGRDLDAIFEKAKNPGEKVELFFVFAENKPEVAVSAFAEILHNKTNLVKLALALQGLGRIGDPHIKRALAACQTEEDLQILRDVANRVKGKGEASSDLTRWAAAWVIENIGFPRDAIEHLQGGALTEPPYRIRNEIIGRKLQEIGRLQMLDSRSDFTPEYERTLDFWVYGPTEELFRANFGNSSNYQTLVLNVIFKLNVRGLELAIDKDRRLLIDYDKKRRWLQEQALGVARRNFCNFTEFEEKRAYETIGHFLSNDFNDDIPLRKSAAQAIKQAGSWLPVSIRARSFVICEEWQQVAAIGEPAVSHLEEVIERKLRLADSESDILDVQIKAVEAISQIQFADFSDKIKKLTKVLLRPEEQVRKATARLLKAHKGVDPNIASLVEALLFEYRLDKPELKDLTVPQMDDDLSSCREKESFIGNTFSRAIDEANSLARIYQQSADAVEDFLQSKQDTYLPDIREWIVQIKNQIALTSTEQHKIQGNQRILRDALSEIRAIDSEIYEDIVKLNEQSALNSTEYQTYNQCQKLSLELRNSKYNLLTKINSTKSNLYQTSKEDYEGRLQQMLSGIVIILFMIIVSSLR
jgi:hypothetical protein